MKDIKQIIAESVNSGNRNYVQLAVNQILGEGIEAGTTVAVVDDPISGFTGAKGKVKTTSEANPGFVDVELENGTTVKMQSSLLVPV
jgi:hypothetical protein